MCTSSKFNQTKALILGLGANVAGEWGSPRETFARALRELERAGITIVQVSNYYSTKPVSDVPQPTYLNAVVLAEADIAPGTLLRLIKRLEQQAGRKTVRARASRPLDVDILHYGGRRIGRQGRGRERGRLLLPHPEMHRRAFVLVPLRDVAPSWWHPGLGRGVKGLLAQLTRSARKEVRQALDSATGTCEKKGS